MQRQQVLIVDDDETLREMYQEILTKEGYYDIDLASDGDKGLEKLRQKYYDFVYLDIIMPKKSGFDVLKEVKESGLTQGKIVFFTNLQDENSIEEAFRLGVDGYELLSEITPTDMLERIKGYISGRISKEQSRSRALGIEASQKPSEVPAKLSDHRFNKFFNKFLFNTIVYGFVLVLPFLAFFLVQLLSLIWAVPIGFLFFLAVGYGVYSDLIQVKEKEHKYQLDAAEAKVKDAEQKKEIAEYNESLWRQSLKERTSGFSTLFQNIEYYEKIRDDYLLNHLRTKPHPALSSADIVEHEAKRRRAAEFALRTTLALIEYYENVVPSLLDVKGQVIDESDDALREHIEEERVDPVRNYLTDDEYRKLSSTERNQMALDKFWRRTKSKWLIGRLYERYIGYLYEAKGYEVEYVGISKGKEDLGRDLICKKGKEIIIIQCKNWAHFKTIFEKHIFQFFGTVFQYRDQYHIDNVRAIFYTSTSVSDLARRFAKELGIELVENYDLDKGYPSIKCNIAQADGTKIYHLPFDQKYDNTKIEPYRGEFYCSTVKEAEEKGFRRAFRWRGLQQTN